MRAEPARVEPATRGRAHTDHRTYELAGQGPDSRIDGPPVKCLINVFYTE